MRPILRYLIMPSFNPPVAYFLSDRGELLNGFRFYGVKATWRSDVDFARLNPIMWPPTIELLWVKVHDDFAGQLNETLAAINVKVHVEHSIQLDGTQFEIAFGVDRSSFIWGNQPPPEWAELAAIGESLAFHIDELLEI